MRDDTDTAAAIAGLMLDNKNHFVHVWILSFALGQLIAPSMILFGNITCSDGTDHAFLYVRYATSSPHIWGITVCVWI